MKDFYDPIVAEIRHNREKLQEMYGGWDGYLKHQVDMVDTTLADIDEYGLTETVVVV